MEQYKSKGGPKMSEGKLKMRMEKMITRQYCKSLETLNF